MSPERGRTSPPHGQGTAALMVASWLIDSVSALLDLLQRRRLGHCRVTVQLAALLDTGDLLALGLLLERDDLRLERVSLNVSDRVDPGVLQDVLAQLDVRPELQGWDLSVNGCASGPLPPDWRPWLVGLEVCLRKGGPAMRQMLFRELDDRLNEAFDDANERREAADFLGAFREMRLDDAASPLSPQHAQRLQGLARRLKDKALKRAVALLSEAPSVRCTDLAAVQNPQHWVGPLSIELDDRDCEIGTQQARGLLQVLQQAGVRLSVLRLNLADDIDLKVLHELLSLVAAHPELKDLKLFVGGSDGGAFVLDDSAMRSAIAGAPGCLKFRQVRCLLFAHRHDSLADAALELRRQTLGEFISTGRLETDGAFSFLKAECLTALAMQNGDEALLIAVAMACPGQQMVFGLVPYAKTCKPLDRLRLPYRLHLSLEDDATAEALCTWIATSAGAMFQGIALERVHGLSERSWTALLNALAMRVDAGGLRAVRVKILPTDVLVLDKEVPLGSARLQSLVIETEDFSAAQPAPPGAVHLIEVLRPRFLSLSGSRLESCCDIVAAVKPAAGVRLQGLVMAPLDMWSKTSAPRLIDVFKLFQGPGFVTVYLPRWGLLRKEHSMLKAAVEENPLLNGVAWKPAENVSVLRPWRRGRSTKGADPGATHWLNPLQRSRWRYGAEMFFEHHGLTGDLGQYLVKLAAFSDGDLRNLANASAVARRRGQLVALAHAMNKQPALAPQVLRALLSAPTGDIDAMLKDGLHGVLSNMNTQPWVWPLFEAATRSA